MRVTTKGQVTIPRSVREQLGIVPGSKVEFRVEGDRVYLEKVSLLGRGELLVKEMTGKGSIRMSTDEILALTRGAG